MIPARFGIWNAQARGSKVSIDLDEYSDFCLSYPKVSYYVNLDVIPGSPGKKNTLTRGNVEEACVKGWMNYCELVRVHGMDKIIPVYHQNDDDEDAVRLKWLETYLRFGVPYIGISPANDMHTNQKLKWMKKLRRYLFDRNDKPAVKTHGFAVTSYRMMKEWAWHSVDSASWKQTASNGLVYFPRGNNDNFSDPPLNVVVAPTTQYRQRTNDHYNLMSPGVRERFLAWLHDCGADLGSFVEDPNLVDVRPSKEGVIPNRSLGESWYCKRRGIILRPKVVGVVNSFEDRCKVNIHFMNKASVALREHVRHIYFAGALTPYPTEFDCKKRLLSYMEIGKSPSACKRMEKHLQLMQKERERLRV